MKIISHRGNLKGREPEKENHPEFIRKAHEAGFEVEIDVWYENGVFLLGHDVPQYAVAESWLTERMGVLWCHAKCSNSLYKMLELGLHCFWHQSDRFTLTSRGIPWCYPNNYIINGVTVVFDDDYVLIPDKVLGICTDYPLDWKVL